MKDLQLLFRLMKNKNFFLKITGLEFLYLFLSYLVIRIFSGRIYESVLGVKDLTDQIALIQPSSGIGTQEATDISAKITEFNSYFNQVAINLSLLVLLLVLVYILVKSVNWNFVYNEKIKDFKKYFGRFTLLSLIFFVLSVPLLFYALVNGRRFLLPYMFENAFLKNEFAKIIIFVLLFVLLMHLTFTGYVYLSKNNFVNAIKEIFKFRKIWMYFLSVGVVFLSFFVIKLGSLVSASFVNVLIQLLIISFIFASYKAYFVRSYR